MNQEDNLKKFYDVLQYFGSDNEKHIWCPIEEELYYRFLLSSWELCVNMKTNNFFGVF